MALNSGSCRVSSWPQSVALELLASNPCSLEAEQRIRVVLDTVPTKQVQLPKSYIPVSTSALRTSQTHGSASGKNCPENTLCPEISALHRACTLQFALPNLRSH